jgi:L-ribulose-5-phosphate 4-epimerase
MTDPDLRRTCLEANLAIQRAGLGLMTWGNASVCDHERGLLAIKPSGVAYDQLSADNMVLVELATGRVLDDGKWRPSSDTPTHRALFLAWPEVGAIVHTHSRFATAWCQAGRDLPCFGTTHADYFGGAVPCTDAMTEPEIRGGEGYEWNTGGVILRAFRSRELEPMRVPAVLVRHHAPFVWGRDADAAVNNAIVLEAVAETGVMTLGLNPRAEGIPSALLGKHFERKHGAKAYYGQARD